MLRRTIVALALAAVASPLLAAPAAASCIRLTVAEQERRADVIFEGVALDGPTSSGVERFRVTRYLKGSGPEVVGVQTGRRASPDGTGVVTSVSITAKPGEAWRIYATESGGALQTSVCDGSRLAGASAPGEARAERPGDGGSPPWAALAAGAAAVVAGIAAAAVVARRRWRGRAPAGEPAA